MNMDIPEVVVNVEAQLAPCVNCREPMQVLNGKVTTPEGGRLSVWVDDDMRVMITVHHHLCDKLKDGRPVYRGSTSW